MLERIAFQGRCWYQAKIKVTCGIFLRKPSKSEKNKIVKFMAYKTLQSNKWDLFLKEINGFMLNVTDHYCISPATSKGGFPVIRVICHESVIYVTGHVSHRSEAQGLLPRITRQSETFLMATGFRCRMLAIYQSLSLFLGLTYRASSLLCSKPHKSKQMKNF